MQRRKPWHWCRQGKCLPEQCSQDRSPRAGRRQSCPWEMCCRHQWRRCQGLRRSEEHTSELQSRLHLVCRLLLEKKKNILNTMIHINYLHARIPTIALVSSSPYLPSPASLSPRLTTPLAPRPFTLAFSIPIAPLV